MIKFITRFIFTIAAVLLSASAVLAQNTNLYVIDSLGDHPLPGWYSGGDLTKYSHKEDNLENGYGVISSSNKQVLRILLQVSSGKNQSSRLLKITFFLL